MKQDNLAFGETSVDPTFIFTDSKDPNDVRVKYKATRPKRSVYLCLSKCECVRQNMIGLGLSYSDNILLWLSSHMSTPQMEQRVFFFHLTALKVI